MGSSNNKAIDIANKTVVVTVTSTIGKASSASGNKSLKYTSLAAHVAKANNTKIDKANNAYDKKYLIKTSGNACISRAYFKTTHEIENVEIESKGLFCLEKLVRLAFIQIMQDDLVLGRQEGFIEYIKGLSNNFETILIEDWSPEKSAARIFDFMVSFYYVYAYQWKRHGRLPEKSLDKFLEILRDSLDFAYIKISEKFELLPKDIKETVNKAFFLTNQKIDDWHEARLLEISAA